MRRPANPLTQQRTSGDRYDDQHTRLRSSEHPTIDVTPRNFPTQQRTSGIDQATTRTLTKPNPRIEWIYYQLIDKSKSVYFECLWIEDAPLVLNKIVFLNMLDAV
uniref:Uncharacterized protein n=1 Tax=Anopheles maculatus TaxID=74869 RepID=A0A182SS65_9DIPT